MTGRRTVVAIVAAGVVVGLAGVGVGMALDDPEQEVGSIRLTETRSQPAAGVGSLRQVPALDEVTGVVERLGDDIDDLTVGRVDLDFGPDSWIADAGPLEDYDGDGTTEAFREELAGLIGSEARLRVRLDNDGDDADVYTINDQPYRDVSGPAPWQSASAVGEDQIRAAATAAVGEGARVTELEAETGSTVAWVVEVIDSAGREYDVLLDAAGTVIDVRRD